MTFKTLLVLLVLHAGSGSGLQLRHGHTGGAHENADDSRQHPRGSGEGHASAVPGPHVHDAGSDPVPGDSGGDTAGDLEVRYLSGAGGQSAHSTSAPPAPSRAQPSSMLSTSLSTASADAVPTGEGGRGTTSLHAAQLIERIRQSWDEEGALKIVDVEEDERREAAWRARTKTQLSLPVPRKPVVLADDEKYGGFQAFHSAFEKVVLVDEEENERREKTQRVLLGPAKPAGSAFSPRSCSSTDSESVRSSYASPRTPETRTCFAAASAGGSCWIDTETDSDSGADGRGSDSVSQQTEKAGVDMVQGIETRYLDQEPLRLSDLEQELTEGSGRDSEVSVLPKASAAPAATALSAATVAAASASAVHDVLPDSKAPAACLGGEPGLNCVDRGTTGGKVGLTAIAASRPDRIVTPAKPLRYRTLCCLTKRRPEDEEFDSVDPGTPGKPPRNARASRCLGHPGAGTRTGRNGPWRRKRQGPFPTPTAAPASGASDASWPVL